MSDERSLFGRSLSRLVIAWRRKTSTANLVGSLVGTGAAEAIAAGWTADDFARLARTGFADLEAEAKLMRGDSPPLLSLRRVRR